MRTIKYIVEHCTASWQTLTLSDLMKEFKDRGWKNPGYHHVIFPNGQIVDLLNISTPSNGVLGYNENSIHYSFIGGIEKKEGKIISVDNRTKEQKDAINTLRVKYANMFPNAVFLGHRDFSRDVNGNGKVDAWERIKECPCYDVRDDIKSNGLDTITKPSGIIYKLNKPLIKDSFVIKIQEALKKAGIKNEHNKDISIDGYFGAECDYCVKSFQTLKGIKSTGIVDSETKKALSL